MQKGGALQERVYGRFLLDLHKEEITRTITAHIHDLSNLWKEKEGGGEKRGHIAIWIIHSLGGEQVVDLSRLSPSICRR